MKFWDLVANMTDKKYMESGHCDTLCAKAGN